MSSQLVLLSENWLYPKKDLANCEEYHNKKQDPFYCEEQVAKSSGITEKKRISNMKYMEQLSSPKNKLFS